MNSQSKNARFKWVLTLYGVLFMLGIYGCLGVIMTAGPGIIAVKQLLWLLTGIFVLLLLSQLDFSFWRRAALPGAMLCLVILVLTLLLGVRVNGMRGWLGIGNFLFQPSEFGKVFLLLSLCMLYAKKLPPSLSGYLRALALSALFIFLIILQPDFGTAAIYSGVFLLCSFLGGVRLKYLVFTLLGAVPVIAIFALRKGYVIRRLLGFLDPGADPTGYGWHIRQFQYAVARGGWFGCKEQGALWAKNYLPLAHSDSVFASLCEAQGFFGILLIFILLSILVVALYKLTKMTNDYGAKLWIFSFGALFMFQTLVHMAVNLSLLPPTGITMPLLSYGGSSMFTMFIGFAIVLSAGRE